MRASIFTCLLNHAYEVLSTNIKMERQRWQEKPKYGGGLEPNMLLW